jgi:hypothetical protein
MLEHVDSIWFGICMTDMLGTLGLIITPQSKWFIISFLFFVNLIGIGTWLWARSSVRKKQRTQLPIPYPIPVASTKYPDTPLGNFKSFLDCKIEEANELMHKSQIPALELATKWYRELAKGMKCALGDEPTRVIIGDRFSTTAVLFHKSMPETITQGLRGWIPVIAGLRDDITSDKLLNYRSEDLKEFCKGSEKREVLDFHGK